MATNNKFSWHRSRSLPVAAGVKSGEPVIVGSLVGVALTDRDGGGNLAGEATVALDGAWIVPVTTTTARAVGEPVFIIPDTRVLTTTDSTGANPVFGYCLTPKGATAGDVVVELAQV